nr:unnamed protein product [Callosobruchus analis]
MFTTDTLNKFNDRPTTTKPLGARFRELLQDIYVELPSGHTVEFKIPPRIIGQPKEQRWPAKVESKKEA